MAQKKIKIYMGITTTGTVVDSQAYLLRDIADNYSEHVELVYPPTCVRRIFHDFARNMVVEEFLASDCDVLWFLDSDITPGKFVLDLVALHWDKWQVAGATYPVFMVPPGGDIAEIVFTAYERNPSTGNLAPTTVPKEGSGFIDGLATGCLFIKREVFSKLSQPYFEFKYENATRNLLEGEDLGFCRKLADQGIKFFTDYSLVCKHEKKVDLLDLNNYAIQYSNRAVLAYDKAIKETISPALNGYFQKGYQKGVEDAEQAYRATPKPAQPKSSVLWTP